MAQFHYFTLEEVYQYAESLGYSRDHVCVEYDEDYEDYTVSFGHQYTEEWIWSFESLEAPAVDYDHCVWED